MEYDEFRIEVTPSTDPGMVDRLNVRVIASPTPAFEGNQDLNLPIVFTAQMLSDLRDPHGHPKANLVQGSGAAVWNSLMGPNVGAAFLAVRELCTANRGLRLVTVLRGKDALGGGPLNPGELPVESLHHPTHAFIAHDVSTPLVRSFSFGGDYSAGVVTPPLRILLVSASPNDLPKANITNEVDAIEATLKGLVDKNLVRIEKRPDATLVDLQAAVSGQTFDIVHFICHGSRGAGADSYICLINPGDSSTMAVDAATLNALFKNCAVRLFLFSACSSAALPAGNPPPDPYPVAAFSGIAQSVLAANNQLGAVIAMQFDFETPAAVEFAKTFYQALINDRKSLEESVNAGRMRVLAAMGGVAHRAWVTPVIYSRAKSGGLFDLSRLADVSPLSPTEEKELSMMQQVSDVHVGVLEDMCKQPGGSQIPIYKNSFSNLEAARTSIAKLLRFSARLINVSTKQGAIVDVELRIVTIVEYPVRNLLLKLRFSSQFLQLQAVTSQRLGKGAATSVPFATNGDDTEIFIPFANDATLPVGDRSIATLRFLAPATSGRFPVEITSCGLQTDKEEKALQVVLYASVFVEA